MIPMGVGKDKIKVMAPLFNKKITQTSYAGAGIDNDQVIAVGSDLQTGSVTPIFDKLAA
jgi:hypothetical protein